ncbi:MAG: hypothetical protein H7841_12950 [Magnetospirillum sp. WYHS-4]
MNLNRSQLDEAVATGVLGAEEASRLWEFLVERAQDTPSFRATHVLYYLGGMIAIGAMTLFVTLGWERFGGWGLFSIAIAYGIAGLGLTEFLLNRRRLAIPAGIAAVFVVALVPLAVYGVQAGSGWWEDGRPYREYHTHIDWRWMSMEIATLVAGALLVARYRLPFLVLPVAVTLWYMSMDLTPFLFGEDDVNWDRRKMVSVVFGLFMVALAVAVDLYSRRDKDFAFWLYIFGVMAFWGGLSAMESDSEMAKVVYLCINLAMIAVGSLLARRVFAVFGALGAAGYLGHLAYEVFEDSLWFPFALTLIGGGVVYLGIVWQRHEATIGEQLRRRLPSALRDLVERRR